MKPLLALLAPFAVLLASCTTITTFENAEETEGRAETGSSGGLLPTTAAETSSGEGSSTTSTSSGSSGEDGNTFLVDPTADSGACGDRAPSGVVFHETAECSVLRQDCCPGEACRPWANDGGPFWNATRCSPVDPDPVQVAEPCVLQGNTVSGFDNCDFGLMCWNADPDTLEGTCIELCTGESDDPVCSDTDDVCGIFNEGVLPLCLPSCDLLSNDCESDDVCIPAGDETFGCIAEQYPRCPAGTTEVNPRFGLGCSQDEPCCAAYCDLSDEASCGRGLECAPFPEPYATYPNLGVCLAMEP